MSLRHLKLTLEYDGTDFAGWQRQAPPARTVQQTVEDALSTITREPTCVAGSGRTDAGVHARAQIASFATASVIPCAGLLRGLNALLPGDVAVVLIEEIDATFHARRSARGKHYAYRLWNREARSPLHARTSWHIHAPLDVAAMREAAAHLVGEHDFSAFRAANCDGKNPVRIVRSIEIADENVHLLRIDLKATAFLRNMVRVIAGTLVEVGLGRRAPASVAAALASRDRAQAGRTAPPHGLTLEEVYYPPA